VNVSVVVHLKHELRRDVCGRAELDDDERSAQARLRAEAVARVNRNAAHFSRHHRADMHRGRRSGCARAILPGAIDGPDADDRRRKFTTSIGESGAEWPNVRRCDW